MNRFKFFSEHLIKTESDTNQTVYTKLDLKNVTKIIFVQVKNLASQRSLLYVTRKYKWEKAKSVANVSGVSTEPQI